jgi:hypothetical protein
MDGITIISHIFDAALQGKTKLIVKIMVNGSNTDHTILEFVKKIILDLSAVPVYHENCANA